MSKSTPHIISIWLVDPVGGTFVDWPPNPDAAEFGDESLMPRVFASPAMRSLSLPLLAAFGQSSPSFWVAHDELDALVAECTTFSDQCNSIATDIDVPTSDLSLYIDRLRLAATHAMSIPEAGVCIT